MADIPAPPYCSGYWIPINPSAAILGISSIGKCCSASHVRTDFGFGKLANRTAQERLVIGRTKVHEPSNFITSGYNEPMPGHDAMKPAHPGVKLTYDDFVQFPDDGKRHELIDGEHYVTPSPNTKHQEILGNLFALIWTHLQVHP